MDWSIICFILAIIVVGVLIFVAILITGKRTHHFNIEAYQTRFLAIENKFKKDTPATYAISIINADKLLDKALIEMGATGKTMGDRLKKSGDHFTEIDNVWRAHKLRNAIAHDTDIEIGYKQAATALAIYKQALKDIGAI